MSDVTQLLHQISEGDANASAELLPLVYEQLRGLAAQKLRRESVGQTLQGTALVHEAYIKLIGPQPGSPPRWQDRRHFFGAAAEAMRRILIDNARRKQRVRHGGQLQRVPLPADLPAEAAAVREDILQISEALDALAEVAPDKAELVKLRYFAGLTLPEIAEIMGISRATASRHWAFAKAWLYDAIEGSQSN